jgi:hypothetical protein
LNPIFRLRFLTLWKVPAPAPLKGCGGFFVPMAFLSLFLYKLKNPVPYSRNWVLLSKPRGTLREAITGLDSGCFTTPSLDLPGFFDQDKWSQMDLVY